VVRTTANIKIFRIVLANFLTRGRKPVAAIGAPGPRQQGNARFNPG
jgi:hypothetical protein